MSNNSELFDSLVSQSACFIGFSEIELSNNWSELLRGGPELMSFHVYSGPRTRKYVRKARRRMLASFKPQALVVQNAKDQSRILSQIARSLSRQNWTVNTNSDACEQPHRTKSP